MLIHEAQRIVDQAFQQSMLYIRYAPDTTLDEDANNYQRARFIELESDEWKKRTQEKSKMNWPTIAEFTDENVGLEKITEYIEKVTNFIL